MKGSSPQRLPPLKPQPGSEVLKGLDRLCDRDDPNFWSQFLQYLGALCHAPWVARAELLDDELICGDQIIGSKDETPLQTQGETCKKLLEKCRGRALVHEPWRGDSMGLTRPILVVFSTIEFHVFLLLEGEDQLRFNEMLVRCQLMKSWPKWLGRGTLLGDQILDVLRLFDDVVHCERFQLAAMTMVNTLATRWSLSKVSLGWKQNERMELIAISNMESHDKHAPLSVQLRKLFDEVDDLKTSIIVEKNDDGEHQPYHQHRKALQSMGLNSLLSLPLMVDDRIVGALTVEWKDRDSVPSEHQLLDLASAQLSPWLEKIRRQERWWPRRCYDQLVELGKWVLGPRHTFSKLMGLGCSGLLCWSIFDHGPFHLEGTALLETDNIAFLSAPFHGKVDVVYHRAGDLVEQDDVLLSMDQEELKFKVLEEEANVIRFEREAEKYRSERELVNMKVSQAKALQSKAELQRVRYYLEQADLKAPFQGVVVEGEKEELAGAPVNKGDILLKIAHPSDLHVNIKLMERDVDHLEDGMGGALVLLSQPGVEHAIELVHMIPMAQADGEVGNTFTLKAKLLEGEESWWRPGMSGVVKLDAGQRPWIWLAFHRTIDAIRYWLWW